LCFFFFFESLKDKIELLFSMHSVILRVAATADALPRDALTARRRGFVLLRQPLHLQRVHLYSHEKVANREIRVWHFVIENGY
jgi:hypothetical protein